MTSAWSRLGWPLRALVTLALAFLAVATSPALASQADRTFAYDKPVQLSQRIPAASSLSSPGSAADATSASTTRKQPQPATAAVIAAEAVPARLARVTEARFAGSPSLGPPGAGRVFVTAADDIQGITTSQGLAQRLTLLDDAGKLREGPFSVSAFDTPAEGLGVPVFRSNPGFVQGGFTGGGAREFDLPNLLYGDLGNVEQWIVP